jgi:hypothetical protein
MAAVVGRRALLAGAAGGIPLSTASRAQGAAAVDAPDWNKPHGDSSKRMLSDLAFGRDAEVAVLDVDDYDRPVVRVSVERESVNAARDGPEPHLGSTPASPSTVTCARPGWATTRPPGPCGRCGRRCGRCAARA